MKLYIHAYETSEFIQAFKNYDGKIHAYTTKAKAYKMIDEKGLYNAVLAIDADKNSTIEKYCIIT